MKKHYFLRFIVAVAMVVGFALPATAQTTLFSCDFSASSTNYTTGTVGSNQLINGELVPAHTQTDYSSTWHRVSDTSSATLSFLSSYFPVVSTYFPSFFSRFESTTANNGLMLMSMCDQIYSWGGTGYTGDFDAYISFSPFSTTGVNMIRINLYQAYRCFNYDQCWIDYSTNGTEWSAVEINVKNIDVSSNGSLLGWKRLNLPASLGNQSSVYLRIRWSSNSSVGGAYGYFWMIDDVTVTEVPALDYITQYSDIWGCYGQIPQGLQLPVSYVTRIANMGQNPLSNVTTTISSPTGMLGQDIISVPTAQEKYSIIDKSGFFTDTTQYQHPSYGGFIRYQGTLGTFYNGGYIPSATVGDSYLTGLTTVPMGTFVDSGWFSIPYTVNNPTGGDKIWAWDNGVMLYGGYAFSGNTSSNLIAGDPEGAGYNNHNYYYTVRYSTGDTVPAGWVIRGMQIVASSYESEAGAEFQPFLWKDNVQYYDDGEYTLFFQTLTTGAGVHTVTESELNANATMESGDTTSNYNVISVMFPEQPQLEPNSSYRIGYQMMNYANFLPAVDNSGRTTMTSYEVYGGYYSRAFKQQMRRPMIRLLVGPYQWVPRVAVTFNCPSGYNLEIFKNGENTISCGGIDSVAIGSSVTYTVYNEYGYDYYINDVLVDGVSINFDSNSYYDDDGYLISYVTFTLDNVNSSHVVSFSASYPAPTVSIVGPNYAMSNYQTCYQAYATDGATITWTVQGATPQVSTDDHNMCTSWSQGGTYAVVATATNLYGSSSSDTMWVTVISCDPITTFPYTMGFESWESMTCWANDGFEQLYYEGGVPATYNGQGSMGVINATYSSADSWLFTPEMQFPEGFVPSISWYDMIYSEYSGSIYNVMVYDVEYDSYTTLQYYYFENSYDWAYRTLDLSAFAGRNVRIGFHFTGYYYEYAVFDDITVSVSQAADVTFNCVGAGSGSVVSADNPAGDRCGETDYYVSGFIASYDFIPSYGSELTNLYVNNVDRMNDVYTHSSGSSATVHTLSFAVTTATSVQVVFGRKSYHIVASPISATMGMVTGGGVYFHDSLVVLTATAMPHYHFTHWGVSDVYGEEPFYDNPLTFYATTDMFIIAYFEPDEYVINVQPNNPAWGITEGGGEFTYLDPVTVSATAYSGYHFMMWSNGSTYNPYTFPAMEDLDLTAIFISDDDTSTHYFTITTNVNDESMGHVSGGGVYQLGETVTIEALPYDGHHFVQWQDGNSENPRTIVVTGDATYTAYFAAHQSGIFTITVLSNNEEWGVVSGGGSYAGGEQATITATPVTGYYFIRWDDGIATNPRTFTVTGDATYMAIFDTVSHEGIGLTGEIGMSLYPNPAKDGVTVTVDGLDGNADCRIIDINGRVLMQRSIVCDGGCQARFDVANLAKGVYFVRVASERGVAVKKLVISD